VPFACSICEQESTRICASCTKDACDNHLCQSCGCCSDCCECEVPLDEAPAHAHSAPPVDADHPIAPDQVSPPVPAAPEVADTQPQPESHPAALDPLPSEPPETSEV
jgi:hypothetical protein